MAIGGVSVGALNAGDVYSRVGVIFDDRALKEFSRALTGARRDADRTEDAVGRTKLGPDVDRRAFDQFGDALDGAQRDTRSTASAIGRQELAPRVSTRGLDRLSRSLAATDRSSRRVSSALNGAFRVGAGAAVALGAAGAAAGWRMLTLASDAEETASKFRKVFGEETARATKRLNAFARATGASRYELREQAADIQALVAPTLGASEATAQLSTDATQLATDLASFNNTSAADALTALRSGLLGEAEPLRAFGVQLSEARVQAEALSSGLAEPVRDQAKILSAQVRIREATEDLAKAMRDGSADSLEAEKARAKLATAEQALERAMAGTKVELTDAQRMQVRWRLILQDTATAQGDAAETSDGFANQLKRLKNSIRDAGTTIGLGFLPQANKILQSLNRQLTGAQPMIARFAKRVRKIMERDISWEAKVELVWDEIERTGVPDAVKRSLILGFSKFAEELPKAVITVWKESNWWGRAVLAGILYAKFGPVINKLSSVFLAGLMRGSRLFSRRGGGGVVPGGGLGGAGATLADTRGTPANPLWVRMLGGGPGGGTDVYAPPPNGPNSKAPKAPRSPSRIGRIVRRVPGVAGVAAAGGAVASRVGGVAGRLGLRGLGGLGGKLLGRAVPGVGWVLLGNDAVAMATGHDPMRFTGRKVGRLAGRIATGDGAINNRNTTRIATSAVDTIARAVSKGRGKVRASWRSLSKDVAGELRLLPEESRAYALKAMLRVIQVAEQQGKVAKGTTAKVSKEIGQEFRGLPEAAKDPLDETGGIFQRWTRKTLNVFQRVGSTIGTFGSIFHNAFADALTAVKSIGSQIISSIGDIAGKAKRGLSSIGSGIASSVGKGARAVIPGLSTGGRILPGGGSVLTTLHGDERVINADQFGDLTPEAQAQVDEALAGAPVIRPGSSHARGGRPAGVPAQLAARRKQLQALKRQISAMSARLRKAEARANGAKGGAKKTWEQRVRTYEVALAKLQRQHDALTSAVDTLTDRKTNPTTPGGAAFERVAQAWGIKSQQAALTPATTDDEAVRQEGLTLYGRRRTALERMIKDPKYSQRVWPEMRTALMDELSGVLDQIGSLRDAGPDGAAEADPTATAYDPAVSAAEAALALAGLTTDTADDRAATDQLVTALRGQLGELQGRLAGATGDTKMQLEQAIVGVAGQIQGLTQSATETLSGADNIAGFRAAREDLSREFAGNSRSRASEGSRRGDIIIQAPITMKDRDPVAWIRSAAYEARGVI